MQRILLLSNSGRPYLDYARDEIRDFLGPSRRIGFVSAASLGDEGVYFERFRDALVALGLAADHVRWDREPLAALDRAEALFVGGGNTYALLKRVREAGLIDPIRARVRDGLPYLGSSAGSNLAGPTILTTNDWNVVALAHFEALGLVPFNINPHYLEADPLLAAGSETRDDRIAEYHVINPNPVFGIEEGALVRVEDGVVTARGHGRVKVFRRGVAPVWFGPGDRLP